MSAREIELPNGFTPREIQARAMRFFDNGGTRGVYCWPRRFGKDLTFLHQTIKMAHERPGMYFHLLPNHKQARKVLWDGYDNEGRRIIDIAIPPPLRESVNEVEMKIKLKCGALWQLVGADYYDSLMGSNPFGLVFSEAALTDPRAWNFFRPILAGNGGWAAFISTPRGRNWFWDLLKVAKADPFWDWSHVSVNETGHISRTVLEQERREMPDELYRQEYECDFSAANVGAVFGRWIEQAERSGRIVEALPPDPLSPVIISSDLGRRDKASFLWWRLMRGGFELFHHDSASGLDAEEWIERLRGQPRAATLILPHDARVKTFQSRHSVVEQFLSANIADEVRVNAVRKKRDSIAAGRKVLPVCRIDATACADWLESMRHYHFEYDEEQKIFSQEPEHDWSSHDADAFMEGAAVVSDMVPKPEPEKPKIIVPPIDRSFSLDTLWDTVGSTGTRRIT